MQGKNKNLEDRIDELTTILKKVLKDQETIIPEHYWHNKDTMGAADRLQELFIEINQILDR
ncbi:unnamed protein product [marine sediment metagenome]|uniref:Uncharacterized protein n=1 Tax=marine sediment metagenome TaxID=412755 RepID=X1VCR7_9ZZZZ